MFCSECGKQANEGDKFCGGCGEKIYPTNQEGPEASNASRSVKKTNPDTNITYQRIVCSHCGHSRKVPSTKFPNKETVTLRCQQCSQVFTTHLPKKVERPNTTNQHTSSSAATLQANNRDEKGIHHVKKYCPYCNSIIQINIKTLEGKETLRLGCSRCKKLFDIGRLEIENCLASAGIVTSIKSNGKSAAPAASGIFKKAFQVDPEVYFQKALKHERKGNYTRAAFIYDIASQDNHAQAKFNLGNLYLLGLGVREDIDLADKLIRESADRDCLEAIQWLRDIEDDCPF